MPKAPKKSAAAQPTNQAEIKHPVPVAEVCSEATGNPITVEKAKDLLGWLEEDGDAIKFKSGEYSTELEPYLPRRVKLQNNPHNRPINSGNFLDLRQSILTKKWKFNGEPIIVGKTGTLLNGQHTLIATVLAEFERTEGNNKDHWESVWDGPITIDKMIVYGIDESDDVVNTMDTCKSRSLADVIYRANHFKGMKLDPKQRRSIAKIMEHAVRLLWDRTGAGLDAYSPRRTTLECVDFINRHEWLVKAVKHIWEENGDTDEIAKYITLGYASGLCYLMAASDSDGEKYRGMETPSEKAIKFTHRDKALAFWTDFVSGDERDLARFNPLRHAIGSLADAETGKTGTLGEKIAIFHKAWNLYLADEKFTQGNLKLEYHQREDGTLKLLDKPDFGGIDAVSIDTEEEDEEATPEEVEANKEEVKKEALGKKSGGSSNNVVIDYWNEMRQKVGDDSAIILFKTSGQYKAYEDHAKTVGTILSIKPVKRPDKVTEVGFDAVELGANLALLRIKGYKIYTCVQEDGGESVLTDVSKPKPRTVEEPTETPKPAKKPTKKPPVLRGGNG
jgi:mRNA-degrading endonuclease YafQ of YafQ-DinJ toxin-antitoxin module